MKKILIAGICLLGFNGLFAQQNSFTKETSLYQRVTNIEKKSDKFNLFLNMQGDFDATFNKNKFEQGVFNMRQLRIEAKGNINKRFSYRWRQRLNRSNNPNSAIDNLPTSIDIAMLGVNLSDKFSMFFGKQPSAYGGIEYDLNPIEVYEYSSILEYMKSAFLTGVNFVYNATPEHQIQFQILNGLNYKFEDTYNVKNIEGSKLPFVYSLNWNGNLLNGLYNTRWSVSLLNQAKDKNLIYMALGNNFIFNKQANMFFDIMYSREGLDEKAIISRIINKGTDNNLDCEYLSLVAKLNYRIHPKWNVFVKGMYETASLSKKYDKFEKGKYLTSLGYLGGIEYYPMESNLHFFISYVGRSYMYEKEASLPNNNTHRVTAGFIYQLPMF